MPAVNEILIRTAVTAVRKDSHLRVYQTAVDGGIRETQYEGKWTGGTTSIATGKIGTPISAASLGINTIRVYYVGTDSKLKEAAYDSPKPWYDGALSGKGFALAPYSGVSAVFLGGKSLVRVYGQIPDDTIQEWCWNDDGKGWVPGANLGAALPGTQIAATSWGSSTIHIRVYLQDSNLNIIEKAWDGNGWYTGALNFSNAVVRTALGVTSWSDGGDGVQGIRLYYGAPGNTIKEKAWDNSRSWYDGGFSQPSVPASNVAAIPSDILRVYLQSGKKDTAVTEYAWVNGQWAVGYSALPPA